MSYKDFAADLKNGRTGRVFFFYGKENLLIRWAVDTLIKKYTDPEYREFNLVELDENADVQQVVSSALTYPMFPGRRVVVVRNLRILHQNSKTSATKDQDKEDLKLIEKLAKDQPDSSVMIFYLDSMYGSGKLNAAAKSFAKAASSYEMGALSPAEFKQFVLKRIREAGKKIGARNLDYLTDLTGYFNKETTATLDDIERNLEKLFQAEESEEISRELIHEMMAGDDEKFVFTMIDAMGRGNRKRAFQLVINNLSSAKNTSDRDGIALSITGLLTSQFELMYDSLEVYSPGPTFKAMASELGANEYRLKKAREAAVKFGQKKIKKCLMDLYDIDRKMKTGEMNATMGLEIFMASI